MNYSNLLSKTLLFIILAELLSIFAWVFPQFNLVCFGVILLLTFILSLKKLQYGIYIAFAELIIDSYGYLFSFNYDYTLISVRIGIFLVVMIAWLIHLLRFGGFKKYYIELKNFAFIKYYLFLALVLFWGFIWGILRGNNFGNIFLDFNNWLFYLYLLPLITVSKPSTTLMDKVVSNQSEKFWREFSTIVLVALSWLLIKTLIFLYIFSHNFLWAQPELYRWIRDTRVGEITHFKGNFYRIFLQSQIFALVGFFIFLPIITKFKLSLSWFKKNKIFINYIIILLFSLTVIIVSFSRSFWAGLISGLISYGFWLLIYVKRDFIKYILKLIILGVLSTIIIFAIINAPPYVVSTNLTSLISQRTTQLEAAGSSRLNMLLPLNQAIAKHPLLGSGFGTTVSYRSVDPRVLSTTAGASGEYTTYAFEWNYLDLLLKIGLVGLSVYLLLIFKLLQSLWAQIKNSNLKIISNIKYPILNLNLGLFLALTSLLVVNIFTPYLNHPLGIGFILLTSIFINKNS